MGEGSLATVAKRHERRGAVQPGAGTTTNERPAANVPLLPAGAIRALLICDLRRLPMPGKPENVADRMQKGNDDTPVLCIRHTHRANA